MKFQFGFIEKIIFICILLVTSTIGMQAQLFSNKSTGNSTQTTDTTQIKKKKNVDDKISLYYFNLNDTTRKKIDTSISFLHQNPVLDTWQIDLGNFGTPQKSILFSPSLQPNIPFGIESIEPYLFTKEKSLYYNTTRPYTDIYYRMGTKNEQIIDLTHTQNISPNWNIAINYRKLNSKGFYKSQRANHDNVSFTTNYLSKNNRYQLFGNFIYNHLQQYENGGITNDTFLTNIDFKDRKLIPINFNLASTDQSTASNYYRNVSLNFTQNYFLGKYDTIQIDSTEKEIHFKPILGLQHQFYSNFIFSRYKDYKPDTLDYLPLLTKKIASNDSLLSKHYLNTIGNLFSFIGNIRFKNKLLQMQAGYGFEVETPHGLFSNTTYLNNYIFAKISKPSFFEKEWMYDASLKFYVTGVQTIGNFHLQAHVQKFISNTFGKLQIGFEQSLQSTPYLFSNFETNYFQVAKNLSKQSITKLSFQNNNTRFKTNWQINYYLIGNYIYRDSTLQSQQYKAVFPLIQGIVSKRFAYKKWVFDNDILLQWVSNNTPIHLPKFSCRNRIAYENKLIKNKLGTAVGLQVRYNSPYYADNYIPIYYSFATNYSTLISNYPQATVFFNFKVKRFRASVAIDELQQLFLKNAINYSLYPAQNYTFHFGLNWAFIN